VEMTITFYKNFNLTFSHFTYYSNKREVKEMNKMILLSALTIVIIATIGIAMGADAAMGAEAF